MGYDSVKSSSSPDPMNPESVDTLDEYALCEEIKHLYEESSDFRKKFERDWKEYEAFYEGRHWNTGEKKPKVNYVFSIIEYETPILTDSRPGTDVMALQDDFMDDAKVLKEAIDYVYNYNHVNLKVASGVREALKSTNHYLYVDYDPDLESGNGQIVIRSLPWRYVYLDPSEGDIDDMSYIIIKRPVKISLLKRQFPFKADELEPEDIEIDDGTESTMYELQDRYHGPRRSTSVGKFKPTDMAYLYECWRKDYSMDPIPDDETIMQAQNEIMSVIQGMVPEVMRYSNHQKIIQLLQSEQSKIISESQLRQMQVNEAVHDPKNAAAVQDAAQTFQTGQPHTQEGAATAVQLAQHAQMTSDESVVVQMLDDLIKQHMVMIDQNPDGMKPRYPNNMRLTIKACESILYDGACPVDDGKYPIAPIYCYKIDGQPYSTGELKNIIDEQRIMNELFYEEYKGLRLVTNPGWIKDDTSNVDDTTLTNDPGIVVTKKQGTEVTRLPPGQVSPQLEQKQIMLAKIMEQISGITEVTQGKRPQGVSSGVAIEQLQDQAIGRIRLKSRTLEEYTMLRLGELVAARIVKYWTAPKILKNYDDDGRIKTIHFDPNRIDQLDYIVRMSPGSTVGISKEGIMNVSKEMVLGGLIDPKTFVMMNDIPYKTLVLSSIEARDQLQQQAQALLQQNQQLQMELQQLLGGKQGSANGQNQAQAPAAPTK